MERLVVSKLPREDDKLRESESVSVAMDHVAIWPFSTPMDSSGTMIDQFQGIYSRGLCRAFAEGLLRTRLCEVAVCLPIVTIGEVTSWAAMGRAWNLDEALDVQLPRGIDFMTLGRVSIAEQVELHVLLVSRLQRCLVLDRRFRFPRAQVLNCLSEAVAAIAATIVGRPLSVDEQHRVQRWGTASSEAYLAYLEAWSAAAAFRFGVTVANPQAALECARKASRIDPEFVEVSRLQSQLSPAEARSRDAEGAVAEPNGYSEFAYPITIPGQDAAAAGSWHPPG